MYKYIQKREIKIKEHEIIYKDTKINKYINKFD